MGIHVVVQREAELHELVLALRASRGLAGLLHGGQQQRDEHRDDRDHDQEFDQREATRTAKTTIDLLHIWSAEIHHRFPF